MVSKQQQDAELATELLDSPGLKKASRSRPAFFYDWKPSVYLLGPILLLVLFYCLTGFYASGPVLQTYFEIFACYPNGDPSVGDLDYTYFNFRYFLDITDGWGNLPLPTVKVITIVWDVIVGRGGQALMTWLAYYVLGASLLRSMESRPSSYWKFAALAFNTGTLGTLCTLLADLFRDHRKRGFRGTMVMVSMVYISLYLVVFQTVISAMAGYSSRYLPYVRDPTGILIQSDQLEIVDCVIIDGSRIGLSDNYTTARNFQNYLTTANSEFCESMALC